MPTAQTQTITIPTKIEQVKDILRALVLERGQVIDGILLSLIARQHMATVSEPGTAKTWTLDLLSQLIGDAKFFKRQIHPFSTPQQLFGLLSLKAMEEDRYEFKYQRMLPWSNYALLDELLKAGPALHDTLLMIMEEGQFQNGDELIPARPLIFANSNEFPDHRSAAMWDRIMFRFIVARLRERSSKKEMLRARANRHLGADPLDPILSWADIEQGQIDADLVTVPDDVLDALVKLEFELSKAGVEPSPRRLSNCIPIVKAHAYLDGRDTAEISDCRPLRNVLWIVKEDIPAVNKAVLELASPQDKVALDLMEQVEKYWAEVENLLRDADPVNVRRKFGLELVGKLERCQEELDKLEAETAKAGTKKSDLVKEARRRSVDAIDRVMVELFSGMKPRKSQP